MPTLHLHAGCHVRSSSADPMLTATPAARPQVRRSSAVHGADDDHSPDTVTSLPPQASSVPSAARAPPRASATPCNPTHRRRAPPAAPLQDAAMHPTARVLEDLFHEEQSAQEQQLQHHHHHHRVAQIQHQRAQTPPSDARGAEAEEVNRYHGESDHNDGMGEDVFATQQSRDAEGGDDGPQSGRSHTRTRPHPSQQQKCQSHRAAPLPPVKEEESRHRPRAAAAADGRHLQRWHVWLPRQIEVLCTPTTAAAAASDLPHPRPPGAFPTRNESARGVEPLSDRDDAHVLPAMLWRHRRPRHHGGSSSTRAAFAAGPLSTWMPGAVASVHASDSRASRRDDPHQMDDGDRDWSAAYLLSPPHWCVTAYESLQLTLPRPRAPPPSAGTAERATREAERCALAWRARHGSENTSTQMHLVGMAIDVPWDRSETEAAAATITAAQSPPAIARVHGARPRHATPSRGAAAPDLPAPTTRVHWGARAGTGGAGDDDAEDDTGGSGSGGGAGAAFAVAGDAGRRPRRETPLPQPQPQQPAAENELLVALVDRTLAFPPPPLPPPPRISHLPPREASRVASLLSQVPTLSCSDIAAATADPTAGCNCDMVSPPRAMELRVTLPWLLHACTLPPTAADTLAQALFEHIEASAQTGTTRAHHAHGRNAEDAAVHPLHGDLADEQPLQQHQPRRSQGDGGVPPPCWVAAFAYTSAMHGRAAMRAAQCMHAAETGSTPRDATAAADAVEEEERTWERRRAHVGADDGSHAHDADEPSTTHTDAEGITWPAWVPEPRTAVQLIAALVSGALVLIEVIAHALDTVAETAEPGADGHTAQRVQTPAQLLAAFHRFNDAVFGDAANKRVCRHVRERLPMRVSDLSDLLHRPWSSSRSHTARTGAARDAAAAIDRLGSIGPVWRARCPSMLDVVHHIAHAWMHACFPDVAAQLHTFLTSHDPGVVLDALHTDVQPTMTGAVVDDKLESSETEKFGASDSARGTTQTSSRPPSHALIFRGLHEFTHGILQRWERWRSPATAVLRDTSRSPSTPVHALAVQWSVHVNYAVQHALLWLLRPVEGTPPPSPPTDHRRGPTQEDAGGGAATDMRALMELLTVLPRLLDSVALRPHEADAWLRRACGAVTDDTDAFAKPDRSVPAQQRATSPEKLRAASTLCSGATDAFHACVRVLLGLVCYGATQLSDAECLTLLRAAPPPKTSSPVPVQGRAHETTEGADAVRRAADAVVDGLWSSRVLPLLIHFARGVRTATADAPVAGTTPATPSYAAGADVLAVAEDVVHYVHQLVQLLRHESRTLVGAAAPHAMCRHQISAADLVGDADGQVEETAMSSAAAVRGAHKRTRSTSDAGAEPRRGWLHHSASADSRGVPTQMCWRSTAPGAASRIGAARGAFSCGPASVSSSGFTASTTTATATTAVGTGVGARLDSEVGFLLAPLSAATPAAPPARTSVSSHIPAWFNAPSSTWERPCRLLVRRWLQTSTPPPVSASPHPRDALHGECAEEVDGCVGLTELVEEGGRAIHRRDVRRVRAVLAALSSRVAALRREVCEATRGGSEGGAGGSVTECWTGWPRHGTCLSSILPPGLVRVEDDGFVFVCASSVTSDEGDGSDTDAERCDAVNGVGSPEADKPGVLRCSASTIRSGSSSSGSDVASVSPSTHTASLLARTP